MNDYEFVYLGYELYFVYNIERKTKLMNLNYIYYRYDKTLLFSQIKFKHLNFHEEALFSVNVL